MLWKMDRSIKDEPEKLLGVMDGGVAWHIHVSLEIKY